MIFFRIQQAHPYLEPIQQWYESAFPPQERRRFSDLCQLLPCPDMHLCGLVEADTLVGFLIYWHWTDALFVEHFAIDPAWRGQQLGRRALAQLRQLNSPCCLLEVELPQDDTSRRRVHFYERQGFSLNSFSYAQPPYYPGSPAVPMHLMSRPALPDQVAFTTFSLLVQERVYERFYPAASAGQ